MTPENQRRGKLVSLLDFVKFTHRLQKVERIVYVPSEERWENDAEHSYQLAMTAWYLIETNKLNLDLQKVICFALVHDLVEAYAGDTYIYDSPEVLANKDAKEEEATKLLQESFPSLTSMHELISEYEERESPESRFVYALDRLLPIINIYLDQGRTWQTKGITLEMLRAAKDDKVRLSPEVAPYYEELIGILEQNQHLFIGEK